jgi:hypothetical protein
MRRLILSALAVLALLAPAARADDPALELRWHLDAVASGTTFDSSGHARHGTVTGGTAITGRFSGARAGGRTAAAFGGFPQDGLPRQRFTLAPYTAPNPVVGRPKVHVRRKGKQAIVTWSKAALAHDYSAVVTFSDGQRKLFTTPARTRRVAVPAVGRKGGIAAKVVAYSLSGRAGRAGTGRLRQVKPKPRHPHKKKHKRKRH